MYPVCHKESMLWGTEFSDFSWIWHMMNHTFPHFPRKTRPLLKDFYIDHISFLLRMRTLRYLEVKVSGFSSLKNQSHSFVPMKPDPTCKPSWASLQKWSTNAGSQRCGPARQFYGLQTIVCRYIIVYSMYIYIYIYIYNNCIFFIQYTHYTCTTSRDLSASPHLFQASFFPQAEAAAAAFTQSSWDSTVGESEPSWLCNGLT